jgi:hypothetical protein
MLALWREWNILYSTGCHERYSVHDGENVGGDEEEGHERIVDEGRGTRGEGEGDESGGRVYLQLGRS